MRNSCMQEHALTWIQECMAHALIAATGCLLALSDEVVLQGKVHHTTQDHDSSWVMVSGCTMNLSLGSCCTMKQGPETMELPCRPLSALSMMHTVLVGLKATTQAWWVQICVFSMWVWLQYDIKYDIQYDMQMPCHQDFWLCTEADPPRPDFECKLAERPPIAGLHKESGGGYQPRVDCTVIVRPWLTMMTVTRHCQWDNGQQHRQNNIGSV